jgi:lipopolysaccharide export system permease protein
LLNIAAVFLAVPFLVRRESRGVVANLAIAGGVMLALLGAGEACLYLASFQVLPPDVAAWLPVVACGMGATWCARHAET